MDLASASVWENARSFLPLELYGLARQTGFLTRLRGTKDTDSLLRVLLMCALPKASFEAVAGWGRDAGLSRMNDTAVFLRLRDSELFLQRCFEETLRHVACAGPARTFSGYRLLAADATVLCGPKATGTDQRLHVIYDLGSCAPVSVELTGPEGGETLAREAHKFGKGDLVLGDRGYGHTRGMLSALDRGAHILVRFEFASIRLLDEAGIPISPKAAKERLAPRGPVDFPVWVPGREQPLRVIGDRNDKGEPVWLITDLTPAELDNAEVRSLYSLRWQIELFFKRLKSLLDLDELPTRAGPTARPWIWAKLILATLAVLIADERFSPWGRAFEPIRLGEISQGNVETHAGPPDAREIQETVAA
jgi:hypothetical protein